MDECRSPPSVTHQTTDVIAAPLSPSASRSHSPQDRDRSHTPIIIHDVSDTPKSATSTENYTTPQLSQHSSVTSHNLSFGTPVAPGLPHTYRQFEHPTLNPLSAVAMSAGGGVPPSYFSHGAAFPSLTSSSASSVGNLVGHHQSPLGNLNIPPKPSYSPPPSASNKPENNQCTQITYRSARVAAFNVEGRQLICLPQAFELFLKHLVGGLHTVYTKLKRLDITPIICNVEQVRILRGLGAIQPGVNRCKLIAPSEFDVLYDDCCNASARPGRPTKRMPVASDTQESFEKYKKTRLEFTDYPPQSNRMMVPGYMFPDPKKSQLFANGYHYPSHLATMPFMPMMPHSMMSMAMANQMNLRPELSMGQGGLVGSLPLGVPHNIPTEDFRDNNNRLDKPMDLEMNKEDKIKIEHEKQQGKLSQESTERSNYTTDGPRDPETTNDMSSDKKPEIQMIPYSGERPVSPSDNYREDNSDIDFNDDYHSNVSNRDDSCDSQSVDKSTSMLQHQEQPIKPEPFYTSTSALLANDSSNFSSVENLLLNIQGLLKVAVENTKHREKQYKLEKVELKGELRRLRMCRERLEVELAAQHGDTLALQRRLRHQKEERRKMEHQLQGTQLGVASSTMSPTPPSSADIDHHHEREQENGSSDGANTSGSSLDSNRSDKSRIVQNDYDRMSNDKLREIQESINNDITYKYRQEEAQMNIANRGTLRNLMESFLGPHAHGTPNFLHVNPQVITALEKGSA